MRRNSRQDAAGQFEEPDIARSGLGVSHFDRQPFLIGRQENLAKPAIGQFCTGNSCFAAQRQRFRRTNLFQSAVDGCIYPADEKRGNRGNFVRSGIACNTAQICFSNIFILAHRKHQRDVHTDTFGDELLDRRQSL